MFSFAVRVFLGAVSLSLTSSSLVGRAISLSTPRSASLAPSLVHNERPALAQESESTSNDLGTEELFLVGQRVQCRDLGGTWESGVVTSWDPLEVRRDGWEESYMWDECRREALLQGGDDKTLVSNNSSASVVGKDFSSNSGSHTFMQNVSHGVHNITRTLSNNTALQSSGGLLSGKQAVRFRGSLVNQSLQGPNARANRQDLHRPNVSVHRQGPNASFYRSGQRNHGDVIHVAHVATPVTYDESAWPVAKSSVALLVVVDRKYASRMEINLEGLACYARAHHYDFVELEPSRCGCPQQNILFRKHCCVAKFLEHHRSAINVFVLDADVSVAVMDRSLDHWIDQAEKADLVFYEREWNGEIMAGNYVARSTDFAIGFLKSWANYEFNAPRGYFSLDQGAIHLLILDALGTPGRDRCKHKYRTLPVLAQLNPIAAFDLKPYYSFVNCSRNALGGSAFALRAKGGGQIVLLPRYFAWVFDGYVTGHQGCADIGAVFHHNVKNKTLQACYSRNWDNRCPMHVPSFLQDTDINAFCPEQVSRPVAECVAWVLLSEEERAANFNTEFGVQVPSPKSLYNCVETWSCPASLLGRRLS